MIIRHKKKITNSQKIHKRINLCLSEHQIRCTRSKSGQQYFLMSVVQISCQSFPCIDKFWAMPFNGSRTFFPEKVLGSASVIWKRMLLILIDISFKLLAQQPQNSSLRFSRPYFQVFQQLQFNTGAGSVQYSTTVYISSAHTLFTSMYFNKKCSKKPPTMVRYFFIVQTQGL